MAFRSKHEAEADRAALGVHEIGGPSMTKQSFLESSDANAIMRKYLSTGDQQVLFQNQREAVFDDFTEVGDFQACMLKVQRAEAAFMLLPADVRAHFENDPGKMLDAVADSSRAEELLELGVFSAVDRGSPVVELEAPVGPPASPADPSNSHT